MVMLQDHIVSGVWLTKRDTFLTKADDMQLVYSACSPTRPGLLDAANHLILPPTILKPEPLYTGKQVRASSSLLFVENPGLGWAGLGWAGLGWAGLGWAVLCCAVLCCAVLCCAVLCCAVLRCAAPYRAVLCWARRLRNSNSNLELTLIVPKHLAAVVLDCMHTSDQSSSVLTNT